MPEAVWFESRCHGWLYENGEVLARKDREDGTVALSIRTTTAMADEIRARLLKKAAE